jgi:hypothetical protein
LQNRHNSLISVRQSFRSEFSNLSEAFVKIIHSRCRAGFLPLCQAEDPFCWINYCLYLSENEENAVKTWQIDKKIVPLQPHFARRVREPCINMFNN